MDHPRILLRLMILYGVTSVLHFVHNALYISAYPNLPTRITPFGVYVSLGGIAVIGVLGYWLYRRVSRTIGLLVIALAPIRAHTLAMNATIFAEVSAASILLVYVAYCYLGNRSG